MASEDNNLLLNFDNPAHLRVLKGYIEGLRGKGIHRVTVAKVRAGRSLPQNAYLHGVVFPIIAKGLSEAWGERVAPVKAKAFLKDKFLREPIVDQRTGEERGYVTRGTSDLDVQECTEFIERCIEFGREELNVSVPASEEYAV